jgi:hypothetical protein
MGTLTDVGPAGLVPAAWTVTIGAHTASLVSDRTLLIALGVMDVLLLAFLIAAYAEMDEPVLRAWRGVLAGGFLVTLAGTVGLALDPKQPALLAISLYGWMVLPGVAYIRTGRLVKANPASTIYLAAAGASLAGAVLYAAGHLGGVEPAVTTVAGLAVVGVGQTAGIVTAAIQNSS